MDDFITKAMQLADAYADWNVALSHTKNDRSARGVKEARATLLAHLEAGCEEKVPVPLVVNTKVGDASLVVGDYVFASRWTDCDPGDPWMVGFVSEVGCHPGATVNVWFVRIGDNGRRWPNAMKITEDEGRNICEKYPQMEGNRQDYEAIGRVWGDRASDSLKGE